MCNIHTPNCLFYFLSVRLWTLKFWNLFSEHSEININSSRIIAQPVPDFSKGLDMGISWRRTCGVLQLPTSLLHCSKPMSWGMKGWEVMSQKLCHINTHRLPQTMSCFPSNRKKGVKILLSKTACDAPEEKEDLPSILFPGLNIFWGFRAAMHCMYHMYCTSGVKGHGQAMSVAFTEFLQQSEQTCLRVPLWPGSC